MSCTAADFLNLAHDLSRREDADEVVFRCAVSRAYYAALHRANIAFPKGCGDAREDHESTHQEVARRISEYSAAKLPGHMYANEVAKLLPKLRRQRNKADYYLGDDFDVALSSDCIARAVSIMSKCQDIERMRKSQAESPV